MTLTRKSFSVLFVLAFIAVQSAFSVTLVSWSSEEGARRLARAQQKVDFFPLANNFQSQTDKLLCGPTTAAIVLNALRLNTERAPFTTLLTDFTRTADTQTFEPRLRKYTVNSFFSAEVNRIKTLPQVYGAQIEGRTDYGLQLRQLHRMLEAHRLQSTIRVVSNDLEEQTIKDEMVQNLGQSTNYVIINYRRKSLEQAGGGHISPVGAYDRDSDSFLVMDVNPNTAGWVWVDTRDLVVAMRTLDTAENRGYLLIGENP